jgi:hypothetical protein
VVTEGAVEIWHEHATDGRCTPRCSAWAERALEFYVLQRRYAEMLEACQEAEALEYILVVPSREGVKLPEYLREEDAVRLDVAIDRDCPELLMDAWGLRCTLTLRGRRFDCAFPWDSVRGGLLRRPARRKPRFGVIQGGKKD